MHHHVMLASAKHPAISPAIDADQIGHYAKKLALDYLDKLEEGDVHPGFDTKRQNAWLDYLGTLTTSNQISVHPNGIMTGNLDMLTTTECEKVVCPRAYDGKVWTEKNWEGGGDFITAMRSGEVIEIDAEMYDYWLGVLPPVQMGGTLLMPPTGQPREVAFGFAEGWERIVGFWHEDFRRFYCQQSIVTNTRG